MSVNHPAHGPRLASLFGAITSAMQPARLPLALLFALLVPVLASLVDRLDGRLVERDAPSLFDRSWMAVDGDRLLAEFPRSGSLPTQRGVLDTDAIPRPVGVGTAFVAEVRVSLRQAGSAIVRLDANSAARSIVRAVIGAPMRAVRTSPLPAVIALLVGAVAASFLAGGLCRMAAVQTGRRARLTVLEGAAFARARAVRLAAIPLLPTAVIGALALPILIFALLLRVPSLDILAGALFVVPLIVAILGAILATVSIAAAPLMPASVAVEDCDSGDAITRAASLALSRPLLWLSVLGLGALAMLLGAAIVSTVLGVAGWAVSTMLQLAGGEFGRILATGTPDDFGTLTGTQSIAAMALEVWAGLFRMLGVAYLFSLFCDLATRAYLLMRARIDGEPAATISGYGIG